MFSLLCLYKNTPPPFLKLRGIFQKSGVIPLPFGENVQLRIQLYIMVYCQKGQRMDFIEEWEITLTLILVFFRGGYCDLERHTETIGGGPTTTTVANRLAIYTAAKFRYPCYSDKTFRKLVYIQKMLGKILNTILSFQKGLDKTHRLRSDFF